MAANLLTPREIVLFATNCGGLYEKHLRMIRTFATAIAWERHVILTVLPAYRRDCRDRTASVTNGDAVFAAHRLRAYYMEHVAEIETANAA